MFVMFQGNNHHNTALHLAAQNGFDEVAEKLLRAKRINVNKKDLHANTALHLAAQNGQIGVNLDWDKACILLIIIIIKFISLKYELL